MLPMFKSPSEVREVKKIINGKVKLDLLFETPQSIKTLRILIIQILIEFTLA